MNSHWTCAEPLKISSRDRPSDTLQIGSRFMSRIVSILIWIYAGSLLIWLIIRALAGDGTLFTLGFSYLGVWLFLPLVFFIPWTVRQRSKLDLIVLSFPIGLFLWFFGLQFIPKLPPAAPPAEPVSVLSFNLLQNNRESEALLELFDSSQADILALKEFDNYHMGKLGEELRRRYPHEWYYRPAGLAIYSKHPILSQEIYPAGSWPIQSAVIQIHGQQIQLINAHLAKPGILIFLERGNVKVLKDLAADRIDQIAQLKRADQQIDLPTIITCDCNMTSLTAAYAELADGLNDVFRHRGWGLGHTFLIPRGFDIRSDINLGFQRIDYIFNSPEIQARQVRMITTESGSDHRPVWAQFELSPANEFASP